MQDEGSFNQTNDSEKLANELSQHIRELAQLKYESEIKREDSLIAQASQMQTAFSFTTAALFMVAAIAVEYKEPWSYNFLLVIFSSITVALLISLVFATIAQRRVEREYFGSIQEMKKFVSENFEDSDTLAKRNIQWVDMLSKIDDDLMRTNNNKVVLIRLSMAFFYVALAMAVVWFIVAVLRM